MSDGRLGPVLSAQSRRFLRALRDAASTDADPILHPDETLEHGEYVTLCYELHHVILPELEAQGLVEFDRRDGEVTRGATFEESSVVGRTDGEREPIRRRSEDDE